MGTREEEAAIAPLSPNISNSKIKKKKKKKNRKPKNESNVKDTNLKKTHHDANNSCDDNDNQQAQYASIASSNNVSAKSKSELLSKHSTSSTSILSPPPANSFESITPPLSEGIITAISKKYKFTSMTPVQNAVIPLFLKNKDVCVQAVTGSGKTLAFLIPMVEMILRRTTLLTKSQVGGLVISPTRELARQTHAIASDLCSHCSLPSPLLLVGGGAGYRPVTQDLQSFHSLGSDIVVGTPGRIDDVLSRFSALHMNELECLVLDEADVLLDMGFDLTLTNILSRLPRMRRTGLFSATRKNGGGSSSSAKAAVKQLVSRAGLRNPVFVNVDVAIAKNSTDSNHSADTTTAGTKSNHTLASTSKEANIQGNQSTGISQQQSSTKATHQQATPSSLTNYYIVTPLDEKLSRLTAFLKQHTAKQEKIVVFFLTCASVEFYGLALQHLLSSNVYVELLHGKLAPKRREKAMERFRNVEGSDDSSSTTKSNRGSVLLCTDVAARGLDVPDIQWTVQFDAPVDPSQYVHRVGRSARAGRTGSSLIFLSKKEESFIDFLRIRKVPIEELNGDATSNTEDCASAHVDGMDKDDEEIGMSTIKGKEVETGYDDDDDDQNDDDDEKILSSKKENSKNIIPNMLPKLKNLVLHDRDLLEKGTKAFTSYVRAYKEHQCAFIFRFASLDLGMLATSFCLLRLPKMPELKDKLGKLNFKPAGPEIDIHGIKYKDKVREKARQKRLAAELAAGGKNAKQIKAEQRAAEKIRRQKERREAEIQKGRNPNKKRGRQAKIFDEWDELAKEERLHKKLKKGKITKEQYKILMYGDDGGAASGKDGLANDCDMTGSDTD